MPALLTDSVIIVVARLVDDAQTKTRESSHSDIEFQIQRSRLAAGDPKAQGQLVGKAKRVRGTLSWALENDLAAGESLVENIFLSFVAVVASDLIRRTSSVQRP